MKISTLHQIEHDKEYDYPDIETEDTQYNNLYDYSYKNYHDNDRRRWWQFVIPRMQSKQIETIQRKDV